ncbi:MAG: PTS fructose transporter subunit IIA [Nitrospinota bacterium]
MIGIVIVTHGNLGRELVETAKIIFEQDIDIKTVSVNSSETKDYESLHKKIKSSIKSAEKGSGVLVLTDLFGGTPSNISISLMASSNIEVVSGVNLPMVIKAHTLRDKESLNNAAVMVKDYGVKNISIAGKILNKDTKE